jgi:hypothetical protein
MNVSVYVFASHDSLGNRDSAEESVGRKAGTNYWGLEICTDNVAYVLSFSVLSLFVNYKSTLLDQSQVILQLGVRFHVKIFSLFAFVRGSDIFFHHGPNPLLADLNRESTYGNIMRIYCVFNTKSKLSGLLFLKIVVDVFFVTWAPLRV